MCPPDLGRCPAGSRCPGPEQVSVSLKNLCLAAEPLRKVGTNMGNAVDGGRLLGRNCSLATLGRCRTPGEVLPPRLEATGHQSSRMCVLSSGCHLLGPHVDCPTDTILYSNMHVTIRQRLPFLWFFF